MLLLGVLFFPLVAALLVFLLGNRQAKYLALGTAAVELVLSYLLKRGFATGSDPGIFFFYHHWIHNPNINFAISIDGLSMVLILLTTFLVPLIILSTFNKQIDNAKSFYGLILLMQFALIGVFTASDGFLFYIFWELALIPIYFIALLWGEGQDKEFRNRAIFKFFVYTLGGSLFMLLGFIWLYQKAGTFDVTALYHLNLTLHEQIWVFLALFIAFAIKIPILPFHTWQPDTYKEAPAAGSMLLAGIMLKMGLYGLLRWLLPVAPQAAALFIPVIIALCVAGVVYGSIIAIKQGDMKKLIAYSSLAHVGLIAAGIFSLTREGLEGAVIQMISHGINVIALFFAGEIIYQRTGTIDISKLGGIRSVAPKFATCFLIVVLASVALPTTNSFIGEFLLLFGVYEYNTWLSIIAGLTIILGAVYMFRMYQNVMLGETNALTAGFADLNITELAFFVVIIISIFVIGVYPKPLLNAIQPALDNILLYALR